ncbi:MAG: hypothetical protein PHW13_09535 [Methylococcales bacterium]|nr:hypothetical protein [Methylococcales bacterium]
MYSTKNISCFKYGTLPDGVKLASALKFTVLAMGLHLIADSAALASPLPPSPITNTTPVNAVCGYANGGSYYAAPWTIYGAVSAAVCNTGALGTDSGSGPWSWSCLGQSGGATAYCAANLKQDGVCGPAGNAPTSSAPATALCSIGSPSAVTGTDTWNWTCSGVNGGQTTQCTGFQQQAQGFVVPTGSYTSNAAQAEQAQLCSNAQSYPAQWTWDPNNTIQQPRAATAADNLTPRIDQVRNGVVIATYGSFGSNGNTCNPNYEVNGYLNPQPAASSGCGPFGHMTHIDIFRLWQNGDTFLVYPAVYTGNQNNIFIGPMLANYTDTGTVPANITIQGVTVNGIRPVILDPIAILWDFTSAQAPIYIFGGGTADTNSTNIVIENIDLAADTNIGFGGMSAVYVNGGTDITLRQMRIHGFEQASGNTGGTNGIFSTPNNTGTLTLDQIELYENGGWYGPRHNAYINASAVDPNFTVHMTNSWSHDAYYGHLFKSRAQVTIMEGNYFQGGLPQGGDYAQAENYLLDVPNGGQLTMRNNVLVKNASGLGSNGAMITFAVEGADNRVQSVDIENNTFMAFAATYDGYHPIWPFFFWNGVVPGTSGYVLSTPSGDVVPSTVVSNNAFVGLCPNASAAQSYRGDTQETTAFSEIKPDFSFSNPALSYDIVQAGTPAYSHEAQTGLLRQIITSGSFQYLPFGAEDQ